jgi:hypothetical protein
MTTELLDVPWLVWSGLAAVLAALFTVVQIPKQTPHTVGFTHLALRWFHSITWLLLALSFLLRGLAPTAPASANLVAVAGLSTYVTFHIALSRARASRNRPAEKPQAAPT